MRLGEVRSVLARFPEFRVTTAGRIYVDVVLGERRHRVRVLPVQGSDWLRVEGRIVSLDDIEATPKVGDITERVLKANRHMEFVGLARDDDVWLVARSDLPPEAEAEELLDTIRSVARVADRWELLWTGDDAE